MVPLGRWRFYPIDALPISEKPTGGFFSPLCMTSWIAALRRAANGGLCAASFWVGVSVGIPQASRPTRGATGGNGGRFLLRVQTCRNPVWYCAVVQVKSTTWKPAAYPLPYPILTSTEGRNVCIFYVAVQTEKHSKNPVVVDTTGFLPWWERVDSNHRSRRQQIYSL